MLCMTEETLFVAGSLHDLGYHWEEGSFVRPYSTLVMLSMRGASVIDHELVQRSLRNAPLGLNERDKVSVEVDEKTMIVMLQIPGFDGLLPVDLLDEYFLKPAQ